MEKRFALAVTLGLGFSMAVILGTIGIMDGFEYELTKKLREINSDVQLIPRKSFVEREPIEALLQESSLVKKFQTFQQVEAFAIKDEAAKGVLLKTEDSLGFSLNERPGVVIGKELASVLKLQIGQNMTLALVSDDGSFEGIPNLYQVSVVDIRDFGIHEKNLRIILVPRGWLELMLNSKGKTNLVQLEIQAFAIKRPQQALQIKEIERLISQSLPSLFIVRPYWNEFKTLLEAVEIEKIAISLILQIIVIISIFNTLAFIFYLKSKKNQEIFLLQALGLKQKSLMLSWTGLLLLLWFMGGVLSVVFVKAFDFVLFNSDLIQLPGDIYHLGKIRLMLEYKDYAIVYAGALFWILLFDLVLWRQIAKKSILSGLRKEFG